MPRRENEAVAVKPLGVVRVIAQDVPEKQIGKVEGRKGAARMARIGLADHVHDQSLDFVEGLAGVHRIRSSLVYLLDGSKLPFIR